MAQSIKDTTVAARAFNKTMGDASKAAQDFVKEAKDGPVALGDLTKASKATEVAMKGLAIAGNMLAVYLASKIITSLYELSQVSKEVAASAKELSETFNNNTKDIGNYRTEVEDLQETIGNSSSSIADVTDARKRLMEIQDELIQKYGQEQGSIDAITSALHGNKGAWDDLINLQWQDLSNQFNRSDYINTVANFFSGYKDNIERMKKEYGDYSIDIDFGSIYGNDNRKKAEDLLGKFGKLKTTDQNGIGRVTLSGNATEVYSQLLQIQQLVKDSGYDFGDAFESQLTDWANKVKDVSDQYKEMYNQYVLYDKILQDSDHGYTNTFKEITDAYSDYQNAINDQNSELAQQKSDDLAKYIVSAMDTAIENGDSDVADYFRSMYPEIQDIVDSWNFDIKFNANTDGLKDNLSNIVERLGNPSKESLTGFSMSTASDDQKNAYADFESLAYSMNMSVDQLIDKAEQFGLVVSESYQKLVDKYGKDKVKQLTPDQLKLAYTVDNGTIKSWDQLINKITEAKKVVDDSPEPKSVTETISAIDELKTNMSGLDSIMSGFVSGDKLDISNLNSVLSKLKELKEAGKDIDMSSAENAIKQISDSSSIDEAQPAINSLCTQLVYASGILDNVNEADAKLIATRLEGIGITNSSELVEQSLTRQRAASEAATLAETGAIQNLNWEKSESIDTAMASISAIAQETTVTDYAKAALFDLIAQETIFNNTSLDVSQKISALGQLAAAFGVVADSAMTAAGWSDDKTVRAMRHGGATDAEIQAYFSDRYTKQIQAKFANLTPPEVKWGGGSSTNSAKNKSGSGSGSSKDKTTEKQAETFNWMERMLEVIANQHDKINDYISDETKSIDAQQAKLSEIIAIDQQKMDVLKQQIEVYKQYWLKALSEIDEEQLKIYGNGMSKDDLISKITNGALDIQDFVLPEGSTDAQETAYKKLVEGIKNAQSAYQDVEDTEKKLDDTEQDIADHQKERYEKRIEQIEAENDALKSRQDIIQADLDLLEASGGIELEGMYQELIDLSKQQMSLYEEEAAAARDRMSEVEAGSTEYYQLESKINDCTQSIKECQKEQAEWQETIKRLPIERLQKYINMLQNIKQDLQNFIDEQNSLGVSTTVDQYKQLMDISQKEIDKLLEQQKKLSGLLDTYQYGSEKFNDVQDEIQDIDDTISGLIQNMYEWNNSIMQIPIDQLSKVNEQLNLYSNSLGEVLDNYDSVLSAVTGTIDQQIDKINEMRDATEKAYEEKIEPLQKELDLLDKTNEKRKTELNVEQKLFDLEKAKKQATNSVIRNGEKVFEADEDSIRQADSDYQDALFQKKKFDLEQQVSDLESERDKLLEGYDQQIEKLQTVEDKWSKIKDQIQLAADTIKATDLFGSGWQDKVLSGKDDDLYNMFKQLYESTSTEKDKVDEQIASNERIVTMMQRFVELYQDGSITYEKAMAGITQMATQMKDGYSALEQLNGLMNIDGIGKISDISASTNAKVDQSVQLLGEYMGIAKANSDTISQYTSTWNEMKDNIAAQLAQLEKMAKELEEYVKNHTYSSGSSSSERDHDSGSSSSSAGGSGNNYVAAGPGYSDKGMQEAINRGDRIDFDGSGGGKTEQEIKDTYEEMTKNKRHSGVEKGPVGSNGDSNDKYAKLAKELGLKSIKPYEYPAFLKQGEIVFTQEQMKQMGQNLQALSAPKYMTVPDNVIKRTDQSTNIDFKMGDVVLNNVQDGDGFAKAVSQTFKSKMRQELTVQRW